MEKFELQPEMNLQITARLLKKGAGSPLHGNGYLARLFDRDFLEDAYLGESVPDADGKVSFSIAASAIAKTSLDDAMPDFFFVVYNKGEIIFRSQVMENVNLQALEQYKLGVGEMIDLGTFLI